MSVCTSYRTLGSETGALFWSRLWKFDGSRRGVIFCHGRSGHSYDYIYFPDPLMVALVNAGYPVIATDLGGTTTWGNDTAITKMTNAFSQLKSAGGAANAPPLIVCYSMGTLAAYNWIAQGNAVAAVIGEASVCDLAYVHDNNLGGWQTEIETAYGGSSAYTTALPTHNPAAQTSSYTSIPQKLYYGNTGSGDDGLLPNSMQTSFSAAVGSNSSAVSIGNVSHANVPAGVPVQDAMSFLLAHA